VPLQTLSVLKGTFRTWPNALTGPRV
jgi:hypothetical protein